MCRIKLSDQHCMNLVGGVSVNVCAIRPDGLGADCFNNGLAALTGGTCEDMAVQGAQAENIDTTASVITTCTIHGTGDDASVDATFSSTE